MPATPVVTELKVGPGPERGCIRQERLDDLQALLLMGKLRLRNRDPAAVLKQLLTPLSRSLHA